MRTPLRLFPALLLLTGCGPDDGTDASEVPAIEESESAVNTVGYNPLNLAAGSTILYEIQVRTANACDPTVGSASQRSACAAKPAPRIAYRAEGMTCPEIASLERIRLGTIDDLLATTTDHRKGITLAWVRDAVGANAVWLMPLFPNNDRWSIPDACDNLGSPYAVRDYFHAAGTLSRACIAAGRDEYSATPCWANAALDSLISKAHSRGLKVLLDVALNHFGHNYLAYDYVDYVPVRDRAARRESPTRLWDFAATYESALLRPGLMDTTTALFGASMRNSKHRTALAALRAKCPSLAGDALVRAYNAWRQAFDWERATFDCTNPYLETGAPGFFLGSDRFSPSRGGSDFFNGGWRDVKFLFHREENSARAWEFARGREYLFRIMNWWVSRGVDGFRLDHATDPDSGFGSNEWKYLTTKVNYYAARRGQARPLYLAEEFADQQEMNKVADILTEGYLTDMTGRGGRTKDTSYVQRVVDNMGRFHEHAFVMTALETHDERRLSDGTGFDAWTGAGFWGIGAAQRSTPMVLMGQEFGEPRQLAFRKSDLLRARFEGTPQWRADGATLAAYYRALATQRLRPENRALLASNHAWLKSRHTNAPDARLLAQARWSDDGNVVFVFHNLWEQDVAQSFYVSPDQGSAMSIGDATGYRLVDVLGGSVQGPCRTGASLKYSLDVSLPASRRAMWLRLERCP